MMKPLRPQYMLLLLFVVTLGVYCSSLIEITLKPAVIGMDDHSLLQYLLNRKLTLQDIFCVQNPGKYYRPFLSLTFLIDQRLWDEHIFGYRLTNVVLHTCNALLVYAIGRTLLKTHLYRTETSFLAALLFAVHPIAVESVAWISGRTDLLSTWWSLLAFYFYLSVHDKNTVYTLPLSLLCALAAVLSKETGIIVFILIIGWEIYYRNYFGFPKAKYGLIFILLFLSGGILYFVLRFNALASRDMSMEMIGSRILSGEVFSSIKSFFASYGFYIKKFFVPFPLQFAIDTINVNMYAIGGVVLMLLFGTGMFIPMFARYRFYSFWTLLGLLPAAVVSFTDIAWTPWAERYLYFSLVPLSFITSIVCVRFISNRQGYPRNIALVCAALIIVFFSFFSVQRAHVWNGGLALARDTFQKAPSFIPAAVEYARSLKAKGMRDEAEHQLHRAESLSGPKHLLFYSLGAISMEKGNHKKAKQYFLQALAAARNDKKLVLMGPSLRKSILASLSDLEMAETKPYSDKRTREGYYQKAVGYLVEAYNEDPGDHFLLYNIGKLYVLQGNRAEAAKYFEEFIKKWDNDDIYSQSAQKLLKKISFGVFLHSA